MESDIVAKHMCISQAISDFDGIEKAIEAAGVDVPFGTDTSEYGDKITEVYEKGLSDGKTVFNASTHYDFPSVGSVDVIYKAESERLLYQWNVTELKYEVLGATGTMTDIDVINGGNANG